MSKWVHLYYYQVAINGMEKKEENWTAWREGHAILPTWCCLPSTFFLQQVGEEIKYTFLPSKISSVLKKRPTENKPKTIKKMVVGSYTSIITLNVNELNAWTKTHKLAGRMKTCMYALPLTTLLCLTSQIVCNYYILLG